jgi:hypothetical protein
LKGPPNGRKKRKNKIKKERKKDIFDQIPSKTHVGAFIRP